MKQELTYREKAQIFAMYPGAEIRLSDDVEKMILIPISEMDEVTQAEVATIITEDVSGIVAFDTCARQDDHWLIDCFNKDDDPYGGQIIIYFTGEITWDYENQSKYGGFSLKIDQVRQHLINKKYAVRVYFEYGHWANRKTPIELNLATEKK